MGALCKRRRHSPGLEFEELGDVERGSLGIEEPSQENWDLCLERLRDTQRRLQVYREILDKKCGMIYDISEDDYFVFTRKDLLQGTMGCWKSHISVDTRKYREKLYDETFLQDLFLLMVEQRVTQWKIFKPVTTKEMQPGKNILVYNKGVSPIKGWGSLVTEINALMRRHGMRCGNTPKQRIGSNQGKDLPRVRRKDAAADEDSCVFCEEEQYHIESQGAEVIEHAFAGELTMILHPEHSRAAQCTELQSTRPSM